MNLLETEYYSEEQEQDYGVDEEINFLRKDGKEEKNSQELVDFL